MNLTATKIKRLIKRKIATAVLVTASVAAFATLGDGGGKNSNKVSSAELNTKLSLRTTYNYKSNSLFSTTCNNSKSQKFIMLNTVVTYQKGNATYIVPLKKKVLLDKIKFNPTPSRF
jgi:hypothetical protein